MALAFSTAVRNARAQAVAAAINAGPGPGLLRQYDGVRPATGGAATNLLSEHVLSDPVEASVAGGTLTYGAIADDASANATGNATWYRVVDSTGAFVEDGDVGATGSGADMELNNTSIAITQTVGMSSKTMAEGNA